MRFCEASDLVWVCERKSAIQIHPPRRNIGVHVAHLILLVRSGATSRTDSLRIRSGADSWSDRKQPKEEGSPTVSANDKELLFTSGRNGQEDLFVSMRPGRESPWSEPANLGDAVNDSIGDDFSPRLAMNGLALYFASIRAGGFGAGDLYVTTRDALDRCGAARSTSGRSLILRPSKPFQRRARTATRCTSIARPRSMARTRISG